MCKPTPGTRHELGPFVALTGLGTHDLSTRRHKVSEDDAHSLTYTQEKEITHDNASELFERAHH